MRCAFLALAAACLACPGSQAPAADAVPAAPRPQVIILKLDDVKAIYERHGAAEKFLVLQGHPPNWWTEARWNGFIQIVEFLKARGCIFMTPSEYLHSTLNHHEQKITHP